MWVLGYVDSYGAVHYELIKMDNHGCMHGHWWPGQTHKLWRFNVNQWSFEKTRETSVEMDKADMDAVMRVIEKHFKMPEWALPPREVIYFQDETGVLHVPTSTKRFIVLGEQVVEEYLPAEHFAGWERGRRWTLAACKKVRYASAKKR